MSQHANPYAPPTNVDYYGNPVVPAGGGAVPDAIVEHLRGTRPWVIFVAIVGFLFSGLIVLAGLGMMVVGVLGKASQTLVMVGMGCTYVVLGGIYVLPSVGLVRYGTTIGSLVQDPRMELLGAALDQQRWFWKVVGILTAIMVALYPIGVIVAVAVAAAKAVK
jgi:hypothetical protein